MGSGEVGQALARGYARHGHDVRVGTSKSSIDDLPVGPFDEVAQRAELVVLAVLGSAAAELVRTLAPHLQGKVLIDSTNPLDFSSGAPRLFVGLDDSLG